MPATPNHPSHAVTLPAPLAARVIALADEAATEAFGIRFAHALDAARSELARAHAFDGLQIQLVGNLGAGKTTLVRAILRGLGHRGRVRSPTYTLVEPYALERDDGELEVYHFDLYRFNDPAEWSDAGFREYFNSSAICLVEWPQQAGTLLGVPDLVFSLDVDGDGRALTVRAYSASGNACLERC
ncbi:tRNA (adenosine(37)-N6)-threonylcarbamoyltransferase complex ATPase subunit type 1 TsaE [Burkholderia multivorans]|uniref:tRNA (Adenosine(37)-N6)-threonylcarbamoyltransferase complex ATPase subunit type 1 TsaE n=1 Tax=Burkholderia multivorans TaxID=87883 RepID=A0AAP2HJS9_9BURK|nr:tRNA (adenosine(37)-N6)-threonylcarbamoyltransferase complex ATPase subunit type 1 TsaE [Burkholderia multivorans]MBU9357608.1 tRNA (adenosine(37)-N6)-threonylcarbamoyltransferase complex ATPase subunit type 1 TsaE [Burkholderia multivorans]MBU9363406.1 tRNA (adenosine(37)-N6)-threonylcarbamoyltransferase complex ATPase subunit type 1 TsaE [Burkholderia multivorans]MBU9593260.1 tRNA (adenosine(37)-N6)-threonylcarbamoyltransferase complex ATPase subunit type 1 TsaE [Burkholderia multivorans]M